VVAAEVAEVVAVPVVVIDSAAKSFESSSLVSARWGMGFTGPFFPSR
jgi:hypothetical protein